jgi:hypothetical protein
VIGTKYFAKDMKKKDYIDLKPKLVNDYHKITKDNLVPICPSVEGDLIPGIGEAKNVTVVTDFSINYKKGTVDYECGNYLAGRNESHSNYTSNY